MEEFVENFTTFRKWLHEREAITPKKTEAGFLIEEIVSKFKELGLEDVW